MNNKTKNLVLAFFVMLTIGAEAQTSSNKVNIGFNISQFQRDFGIGLHVISPYFIKSKVAVRVGANIQWLENFNGTETVWTLYQNIQLGFRGRTAIISDKVYIYGEGGVITIFPNSDFSSKSVVFGGYGLFGFEFRPIQRFGYFLELGGVGTGAIADRIIGDPIYSNGFLMNVGLRIGL